MIGDLSLIRALGRRGIPVAVATSAPGSIPTLSRYAREVVRTPDVVEDPEGLVDALVTWARHKPEPPVLFYQGDHDLLALSRRRESLHPHLRCVLPAEELVEDLVDKLRFAELAARLSLPVPETRTLRRGSGLVHDASRWDHFPCVLKPAFRSHWFGSPLQLLAVGSNQKAIRVESAGELRRLLPLLESHDTDFVLQAAVEGGEDRIVSYHAYVRASGEVVLDFTGRKLRTSPRRYGLSTCVEITADAELRTLGRSIVDRLGFTGVLKMDFKRDGRDRPYLLEINPRFNLWHHPATVAGACLPELVYKDLVEPGSVRAPKSIRAGVRWVTLRDDFRGLTEYRRAGELTFAGWLKDVATADVNEDFVFRDPVPGFVELFGVARRKLSRLGVRRGPAREPEVA